MAWLAVNVALVQFGFDAEVHVETVLFDPPAVNVGELTAAPPAEYPVPLISAATLLVQSVNSFAVEIPDVASVTGPAAFDSATLYVPPVRTMSPAFMPMMNCGKTCAVSAI